MLNHNVDRLSVAFRYLQCYDVSSTNYAVNAIFKAKLLLLEGLTFPFAYKKGKL